MPVLLVPGQGSQVPGLLQPWLDLPGARASLAAWSRAAGLDLVRLGTTASAAELRDTAVAQPLLTAAALLSGRAVLAGDVPDAVCGHSVGEIAALALAGALDDDEAVVLAARRGAAMARAAALAPTGLAAVLGADLDAARRLAAARGLEVAVVNGAGQVVLGGAAEVLAALATDPPPRTRLRPLDVAGAFHTAAMAPAVAEVQAAVAELRPRQALCDVVANADGARLRDGAELLARLPAQLVRPVRFDLCLEALADATELVEVAPGGVLATLARRALPAADVVALRGPGDVVARGPAESPRAVRPLAELR